MIVGAVLNATMNAFLGGGVVFGLFTGAYLGWGFWLVFLTDW
jgi:hypothetical protein